MKLLAGTLILAALAGCASELKVPDRYSVPAAVACIRDDDKRKLEEACPALRTEAQILELDDYKAVLALRAEHKKASICIQALQAAVQACAKVPAVDPPLGGRRD